MFSKTPRKPIQTDKTAIGTKEHEQKILLTSDSHSVVLLNALPLSPTANSEACVLPTAGLACMTLSDNICVWDYINVSF